MPVRERNLDRALLRAVAQQGGIVPALKDRADGVKDRSLASAVVTRQDIDGPEGEVDCLDALDVADGDGFNLHGFTAFGWPNRSFGSGGAV